jgi:pimeloyl-ACP methyl ester carboxylesterase
VRPEKRSRSFVNAESEAGVRLRIGGCFRAARTIVLVVLVSIAITPEARSQEICGNGTTFTINLPSVSGGTGDTITLPDGCRIYALFVSGYERNQKLDELTFYHVTKLIAENDGYVHYAWWNNLLKEYMAGPLHTDETFTVPVTGAKIGPTPGGLLGVHGAGFVPLVHELGLIPKAVPEDDYQFQADARRMLAAIRSRNPDALIVVAGHSMGGNSVSRLGATTPVDIDLLAPIDPVGNRSAPVGRPTVADPRPDRAFNWTRWRAANEFAGYKIRDCVRNAILLCQNFGTFFNPEYHCRTIGGFLSSPPPLALASLSPLLCPGPYMDPGTPLKFGGRIKRLFHRWQTEAIFPFDFPSTVFFSHGAPRNPSGAGLLETLNSQLRVVTCAIGLDPRDSARLCNPTDGHGEIVGFRSPTVGQPLPPGPNVPVAPLALQAIDWPLFDDADPGSAKASKATLRRARLLELPTATNTWAHRPVDPSLDLVANDMAAIVKHLLATQPEESLTTLATPTPGANEYGWNNENVIVNLTATASAGRQVKEIEYWLTGAQSANATVHAGNTIDLTLSAEGDTTVHFRAKDTAGNIEDLQQLTIRLDKTPPAIVGSANPPPNTAGWNSGSVTVTFTAVDPLSGVDVVDAPVVVSSEGANQEAVGRATDRAGNTSATVVTVSIDRTPPSLAGMPVVPCQIWPPNKQLVQIASVSASDGLSGVPAGALIVQGTSSEAPGSNGASSGSDIVITDGTVQVRADRSGGGGGRTYTVNASISDAAGNTISQSGSCVVPHDQRRK